MCWMSGRSGSAFGCRQQTSGDVVTWHDDHTILHVLVKTSFECQWVKTNWLCTSFHKCFLGCTCSISQNALTLQVIVKCVPAERYVGGAGGCASSRLVVFGPLVCFWNRGERVKYFRRKYSDQCIRDFVHLYRRYFHHCMRYRSHFNIVTSWTLLKPANLCQSCPHFY